MPHLYYSKNFKKVNIMWTIYIIAIILLWGFTDVLYKKGADKNDKLKPFKFSITIGLIFFVISIVYIITRNEPFSLFESAVRFWPVTVFGIIYTIVNTITFQGFMYNEASIVAPLENISNGASVILLIAAYVFLGKVDSVWEILSAYKVTGILLIVSGIILLSVVQHKEVKSKGLLTKNRFRAGAGALIFPIIFSVMDGLETIVTGLCMDKTFGYAMPEGDGIIILGIEYSFFALLFWIFVSIKEKHLFNPFSKSNLPLVGGALCDNSALAIYAYAMAIDSVATDPVLAVYPIIAVIISRILLKEKLSLKQYLCVSVILAGTFVMLIGKSIEK